GGVVIGRLHRFSQRTCSVIVDDGVGGAVDGDRTRVRGDDEQRETGSQGHHTPHHGSVLLSRLSPVLVATIASRSVQAASSPASSATLVTVMVAAETSPAARASKRS